jgi:anti-sigma factor RsiW
MNQRDCNTIFAMLSEYLDRELPPATCAELERHIRDCAPCIQFVDSLKKSIGLCREYKVDVEAPPLANAVKKTLREAYERMLSAREKAPGTE